MACLLGPGPIVPLCLNIKEGEESATSGTLQDINHSNSWPSGKLNKPDSVDPLWSRLPIHSLHLFWLQLLYMSYSNYTSRIFYSCPGYEHRPSYLFHYPACLHIVHLPYSQPHYVSILATLASPLNKFAVIAGVFYSPST